MEGAPGHIDDEGGNDMGFLAEVKEVLIDGWGIGILAETGLSAESIDAAFSGAQVTRLESRMEARESDIHGGAMAIAGVWR